MYGRFASFLVFFLLLISCRPDIQKGLEARFRDPPDEYKPWLYWYWIDENISTVGITRDLEAMARAGIGQALIGHVSPGGARGSVRILSEEWWEMVEFAVQEGQRLGVDIGFFNGPGWSQSGGPWIPKDMAMRHMVSQEIMVAGPATFEGKFAYPDSLFEMVALQALPIHDKARTRTSPMIEYVRAANSDSEIVNLIDNNPSTIYQFPEEMYSGQELTLDFHLEKQAIIRHIEFDFPQVPFQVDISVQCRDQTGEFRDLRNFTLDRRYVNFEIGPMRFSPAVFSMPEASSNLIRVTLSNLSAGPGAGLGEISLSNSARLDQAIEKQLGKMYSGPLPAWDAYLWTSQDETRPELVVSSSDIVDLSRHLNKAGDLKWDIPQGDWIILLSGMVPTGATNVPAPAEATGYECDKFTREAIELHFKSFIGRFLDRVPADRRRSLKTVVIDSYEVGPQNWTDDFGDVFKKRYGYDPIPWIPVFSGRIVESAEKSDRFLWDVRRLTADLISDIYVKRLRELCHNNGLQLWLENYGHWGFPAEFLQYGGQADLISGEFWFKNSLWDLGPLECRAASSAAHIYGKKQVFAEAFTAGFNFRQYPAIMKSRGDLMFCHGINQLVQHVYIHQPREDMVPGVTAWFGMSYQRHNTWFEQSRAWNEYLQRCHVLLQEGVPVSDVCYYIGEDAPKMTGILEPELPEGYDFDFINADVILNRLSVKDGLLTLPEGKTYRLLVLPPLQTMRPDVLRKTRELLTKGANIYGPPPSRSPSMKDYPEADREVIAMARELWGASAEKDRIIREKIGSGQLFYGQTLAKVFQELDITPDVITKDSTIYWTHRRSDDADIYFISNQEDLTKTVEISFRTSNTLPEFWHPDRGEIRRAELYWQEDERIRVPVKLDPSGSVFVVFRTSPPDNHTPELPYESLIALPVEDLPDPIILNDRWTVRFPENWDVPEETAFNQLMSWTDHPHPGIRHFSGTATYYKILDVPGEYLQPEHQVILDLGEVGMMAEIRINGRELGILWKPPYEVNITKDLHEGDNELEIGVTNTWWNRLVGDQKYPGGFPGSTMDHPRTYTTTRAWSAEDGLLRSGLIGPVRLYLLNESGAELQARNESGAELQPAVE